MAPAGISLQDITRSLRTGIRDHGATLPPDRIVLHGGRATATLPSGLTVNLQDTRAAADFETYMTRPANVLLHVVLEGRVSARLGDEALEIGRRPGAPVRIVFSALSSPLPFRRSASRGERLRKLTVGLSWDWLAARAVTREDILAGRTHRLESWVAPPGVIAQVRALLDTPDPGPSGTFAKEALALALLRDAIERLVPHGNGLRPDERDRLARMEALADRPGPIPALERIAAAGGTSVSTMRRLFRRAYGEPVMTCLRRRRMEQAAAALRRGATVSEAARLAGYETPTAFATAFRQATGDSPSRFRRQAG
ncbi:helix-turn-helix transcriptional regulator [Salipiger mucosus]|uniref:HTH araC/xylS-type domain-containing protein n=1 Tax=Salipiger mucosus DSM 16094 TaxID=1123237 RepID=S9Q5N1_9RHOB|nr:helix-turn-helix transcriptional regulator [Salipiger mucosus]EPX76661.1 hypothetical protein Salmuc_00493 [Salipiger mucosus DSM 16094]